MTGVDRSHWPTWVYGVGIGLSTCFEDVPERPYSCISDPNSPCPSQAGGHCCLKGKFGGSWSHFSPLGSGSIAYEGVCGVERKVAHPNINIGDVYSSEWPGFL